MFHPAPTWLFPKLWSNFINFPLMCIIAKFCIRIFLNASKKKKFPLKDSPEIDTSESQVFCLKLVLEFSNCFNKNSAKIDVPNFEKNNFVFPVEQTKIWRKWLKNGSLKSKCLWKVSLSKNQWNLVYSILQNSVTGFFWSYLRWKKKCQRKPRPGMNEGWSQVSQTSYFQLQLYRELSEYSMKTNLSERNQD